MALAVLATHLPALWNGFVYDDVTNILQNAYVQAHNLRAILFSDFWAGSALASGYYRPVLVASFTLDHALGGAHPLGYHLTSLLLHVAATVLLFVAGRRLTGSPVAAALAATLFGVHPLVVECVSGLSNRGDLLVALFALAMLLAHERAGVEMAVSRRRSWWALAAGCYAAACLSKESGILAVALPVLADLAPGPHAPALPATRPPRRLGVYVAYAAVAVLYLGVR